MISSHVMISQAGTNPVLMTNKFAKRLPDYQSSDWTDLHEFDCPVAIHQVYVLSMKTFILQSNFLVTNTQRSRRAQHRVRGGS